MIDSFHNEYYFLSNFYPCKVEFEGLVYPSSEHAYQAAKILDFKLRAIFTIEQLTAAQAKKLGQILPLRPNWDAVKEEQMVAILVAKFQDPSLRADLILTGSQELIEGNNWGDTYWGVCRGKGANRLGHMLMSIRKTLQ